MKKILVLFILFLGIFLFDVTSKTEINTSVRDVELTEKNIDYQTFFNEFDEVELSYSTDDKYVSFSGKQSVDSSLLEDIDFVSITIDNEKKLDMKYEFEYFGDKNIFIMNIIVANVENGEILDQVIGVPFIDKDNNVDIIFEIEGEHFTLSELEENSILQNCGWFSKALKKIAKAAAVVAVVATVVAVTAVAAPAVIAVATSTVVVTSVGTTMVVAGTVASSTLAACAATAATATTVGLAASAIAASSYLSSELIEQLAATVDLSTLSSITMSRIYYVSHLRNNQLIVNRSYALNYIEAASVLTYCGFIDAAEYGISIITYSLMSSSVKQVADNFKDQNISKYKIGIYTEQKLSAARLAFAFGGYFNSTPEIHGSLNNGYLYHFHNFSHSIHVWYSTI